MMTIANMMECGTHHVMLWCACGHHVDVDVSGMAGNIFVPMLKHRYRCSKCGERPSESRPAWHRAEAAGKAPGGTYFKG